MGNPRWQVMAAAALVVAVAVFVAVMPVNAGVSTVAFDARVAHAVAPHAHVRDGPSPYAPRNSVLDVVFPLDGIFPPAYSPDLPETNHVPVVQGWMAVADVFTPRRWQWSVSRIGLAGGKVAAEENSDTHRVAAALRFWWLMAYRVGATGAPPNTQPVSWLERQPQAVAVTTLPIGTFMAHDALIGLATLGAPSVCRSVLATTGLQCDAVTVLWVRMSHGSPARRQPSSSSR